MLKRLFLVSVASGMSLLASAVHAAAADDARSHFQAIAAGDVDAVMRAYAEGAQLQWVGGPLDGSYSSADAIRGVWTKFAGSQGPLRLQVGALEESANPQGATVSANVLFEGKGRIQVRYILTFRDGRIVNEIWQIDPKLPVPQTH
ncbi:nuclear transport factor 2 family protein [Pseudorhodoferax sp.]|uniref:nuclear transport factor 2 family protein n=1 Tax=Pseudorhodoferax sp. TaxID=1993553 RepID=UPI0039E35CB2